MIMTEPTDIPPEWAEAVRTILLEGKGRVVVLGPQDVGKSSFCRVLLDEAVRAGCAAALVDADLGQKAVGPPAAVTLAYADRPGELAGLAFVGTTDPARGLQRVVEGTRRLAAEARADLVVVNTGGLVAGVGRRLKAAKLAAVRPDLAVVLGSGPELDAVVERNAACPVVRLAPSPLARRKSASRRRRARGEAFRRYFEAAPVWHLHAGALVAADPAALPERLLVGIADRSGRDLALAILLGHRPGEGRLDLLGPDPAGRAATVVPGGLCLDEEFRELAAVAEPSAGAPCGRSGRSVPLRCAAGSEPLASVRPQDGNIERGKGGRMAKAVTIYGIKNCDTMKKARAWLDEHGVAYTFHDYKAAGIDRGRLEGWARELGWETLLNRAGTTFRKLPEADREGLTEAKAVALMLDQPSMIKRPVLDLGGRLLVGFKPDQYAKAFAA